MFQTAPAIIKNHQAKECKERRKYRLSQSESMPLLADHPLRSRSPSPPPAVVAPPLKALITAPVIIAVLNYALLALIEISFTAILPVYLASSPLSLTPRAIGFLIGGMGIFNVTFQALCTAALVEQWGAKRVYQVAIFAFFPLWMLLPIAVRIATTSDSDSYPWILWLLACVGVVLVTIVNMSFGKHSNLLYWSICSSNLYRHHLPLHSLSGSDAYSSGSNKRLSTDYGFTHADHWPSLCHLALCRLSRTPAAWWRFSICRVGSDSCCDLLGLLSPTSDVNDRSSCAHDTTTIYICTYWGCNGVSGE